MTSLGMTSLCKLASKYGTDKGPESHGYTEFYANLLRDYRSLPVVMLEIGVAGGESIRMWEEWFTHPDAKIYGVDIEDRPLAPFDSRTRILIADASSPNAVFDITNVTGSLDIIIDDGGHFSSQQKDSLRLLWPHLKSGGVYCIEDCHTSYKMPWTLPDEVSFVHSTMNWIDDLMENGYDDCGKPTKSTVDEIIFRKSMVILKKR